MMIYDIFFEDTPAINWDLILFWRSLIKLICVYLMCVLTPLPPIPIIRPKI